MSPKPKKRIAFYDFACCEGCQLTVLQLEERLLDLLEHVEIVAWREAMSGGEDQCDIAFCEGSVCSTHDLERIRKIRENCETLITLGTCASIGCHNALRNYHSSDELLEMVYGGELEFDSIPARPISAVVEVEYQTLGCPVSLPEFVKVFKSALTGKYYLPPNQPVCVECKLKDNLCVYEKGLVCLGPVTRCGCNAICASYGDPCQGCRGLMDEANLEAAVKALTDEQAHKIMAQVARNHDLDREKIRRKFAVYNNWPELKL
jgi:coenzyme F420-reducing hydrogenase gamma subunit